MRNSISVMSMALGVINQVVWFFSDAVLFVTGQALVIAGGRSAQ